MTVVVVYHRRKRHFVNYPSLLTVVAEASNCLLCRANGPRKCSNRCLLFRPRNSLVTSFSYFVQEIPTEVHF